MEDLEAVDASASQLPARPPREARAAGSPRGCRPGPARRPDAARRLRRARHLRRLPALERRRIWLWAASALLVVHWLGDSLDGTLARVRGIQRPRYGYYLDHLVDAVATAAIGIGLGLSPHMLLSVGMLIVVAYLVLSINVYLESQALGRFSIGYGRSARPRCACPDRAQHGARARLRDDFESPARADRARRGRRALAASRCSRCSPARARRNLRELAAEEPSASRRG